LNRNDQSSFCDSHQTHKLYVQNTGFLNVTAGKVTSVVQRDSQTQNRDSNLGNESLLMGRDLTEGD